jgi:hypothetical protein
MTPLQVGEVNVFRRFSSEQRAKMIEFYSAVLGLKMLPTAAEDPQIGLPLLNR